MICDLIWNEYELVYQTYESFNGFALTIKGWSVTVGLAAIFAVYFEKLGASGKAVLWGAALSSLPFWILDAIWKSHQKAFLPRLEVLERSTYSGKDCKDGALSHSFDIVGSWDKSHDWFGWIATLPITAFPHVFVILLGVYLVIKHPPKA
ncbi:hypothetical protein J7413_00900 [Shimia sp. R10_1]|uniref:hypothetical protein n=1 Tax=Shimia sp. R10_1 TaxID=2821095 RepID=UPI001ADBEBAC|nr:hypothetical protein [Shimia sp. R10_1]MBO9472086.1 hypothetical protein [Shimia sp. R10_1]